MEHSLFSMRAGEESELLLAPRMVVGRKTAFGFPDRRRTPVICEIINDYVETHMESILGNVIYLFGNKIHLWICVKTRKIEEN